MSRNELLNSLTRFGDFLLFYFILLILHYWYIIPIILIFVSLFAGFKDKEINDENSKKDKQYDIKKRCRLPTNNNPYMNLLVNDE